MTPFKTKSELTALTIICKNAWDASRKATGRERLKLIHEAFPSFVKGDGTKPLQISWQEKENRFLLSDYGGFLTMVPEAEPELLLQIIKEEAKLPGALRAFLKGKPPPLPEVRPFALPRSLPRIELGTLNLKV